MKKETFIYALICLCASYLLQSCDIEDISKSLTEGIEEEYVILDKNKGMLQVYEPYKDEAALFQIEDNPEGVKCIEFSADGSYHITFGEEYLSYNVRKLTIEVDGNYVNVPMQAITRGDYYGIKTTGTYTYENGSYKLMEGYNWQIENGMLIVTEDSESRSYRATKVPQDETTQDALSQRLCHTWELSRVLLKLYNMNTGKLVMTYHLTEEEIRENCIDTFVFSASKKFYRYKEGVNNGNGNWSWKILSEQTLRYEFKYFSLDNPIPVYGSNDLIAYFANNSLYLTESCENLNEYDEDEENPVILKAIILYQLDIKESR